LICAYAFFLDACTSLSEETSFEDDENLFDFMPVGVMLLLLSSALPSTLLLPSLKLNTPSLKSVKLAKILLIQHMFHISIEKEAEIPNQNNKCHVPFKSYV
jgi:hypothetical protein